MTDILTRLADFEDKYFEPFRGRNTCSIAEAREAFKAGYQEAAGEIERLQSNEIRNLSASLKDVLSRFRSCIAQGNGEIDGDREAIVRAETLLQMST